MKQAGSKAEENKDWLWVHFQAKSWIHLGL